MSLRPRYSTRDPFRMLAVASIVIGLLMVIGAAVFWGLTGRQSSLIVGAGMTLAIGGGLRNLLADLADRLPPSNPPPAEPPPPVARPPSQQEGGP